MSLFLGFIGRQYPAYPSGEERAREELSDAVVFRVLCGEESEASMDVDAFDMAVALDEKHFVGEIEIEEFESASGAHIEFFEDKPFAFFHSLNEVSVFEDEDLFKGGGGTLWSGGLEVRVRLEGP